MPPRGTDIGLSRAAGSREMRVDLHLAHSFVVELEGLLAGGFSHISGLQVETESFEYREGGLNDHVHRFAGPARHPPLILKHGISAIDGLWNWHQDVVAGVIERRNGTIYLLDAQQQPLMWWEIKAALPLKWTGPDLDASASAVAFESVELVHRGLSRPQPAGPRSRNGPSRDDIAAEFKARIEISGSFF